MSEERVREEPPGGARPAEPAGGPPPPKVMVPRWIQLVSVPLMAVAVWAAARASGPVLLIFVVAAVVALVLNPLVRRIQRAGLPRGLAIGAVYIGFLAAIVGAAALLANPVGDQIASFRSHVPGYVRSANHSLDDFQRWLDRHHIKVHVKSGGHSALNQLEKDVVARSGSVVSFTRDLVSKVVAATFALILVIVISVYMLVYARPIGNMVRRVMPPGDGTPGDDFPTRVERSVARYIGGQLVFSTIMGASAALVLWILGLVGLFDAGRSYAVFFGIFYGVMELVPFVGPILGGLPPVLVALFQHPISAVWVVIALVALQQLEGHVVAPNVFGRALRINPLLVIFALLFGGELYGVIGALVALPVAAMVRETVIYLRQHLVLEPWPASAEVGLGLLGRSHEAPCPACGRPARPGDAYCRHCGERLEPEPEREPARSA
jgi:predicted PurR-regulated permease PerM